MTLYEIEGFLRGKCLPGDLLVGESTAEYIFRKFKERDEARTELSSAMLTISRITDVVGPSDTLSISQQVTELASRCSALAAESALVKERHLFIRALSVSILEHSGGRADWRGAMEDAGDLIRTVNEVYAALPATDAAIANIQAQGVEKFAEFCRLKGEVRAFNFFNDAALNAEEFASQLRKEPAHD